MRKSRFNRLVRRVVLITNVLVVTVFSGLLQAEEYTISPSFEEYGWVSPLAGDLKTTTEVDFATRKIIRNKDVLMTGTVFLADEGSAVYAIGDGKIVFTTEGNATGDFTRNEPRVVVWHRQSGGREFTAVYANCSAVAGINLSDRVVAGQKICTIDNYTPNLHEDDYGPIGLHLGIVGRQETDVRYLTETYSYEVDYYYGSDIPNGNFSNPVTFLQTKKPFPHYFQGTGSLISENTGTTECFGCNKDVLRVHPTTLDIPAFSQVSFQWQLSQRCRSVKFSATNALSLEEVNPKISIRIGPWNTRDNDKVYSNITLPFVVSSAADRADGKYSTAVIRFNTGVAEKLDINAQCLASGETTAGNVVMKEGGDYSGLTNGFGGGSSGQWNGNGSIISKDSGNCTTYGCLKDEARIHPTSFGVRQEVYFQWQGSDDRCPALSISAGRVGDDESFVEDGRVVEASMKPWNVDCNQSAECKSKTVTLPHIFEGDYGAPDGKYRVMKIKFVDKLAVGEDENLRVLAQCVVPEG